MVACCGPALRGPPTVNLPVRRFLDAIRTVGARNTPGGNLSHPAIPTLSVFERSTKEFKPFLRDMVRYSLTPTSRREAQKSLEASKVDPILMPLD